MSSSIGRLAEDKASQHLKSLGFKIVATNHKTKYYEIDLVAKDKNRYLFVEIKYRKNEASGTGLEFVDHYKKSRIEKSALAWMAEHQLEDEFSIAVMSLSGPRYSIDQFVELFD